MENSETVHSLIEIQSLLKHISVHKKNISEHQSRTESIKVQRQRNSDKLSELKPRLVEIDGTFNEEDLLLKKLTKELDHKLKQKDLVRTEKELTAIEHDITKLQNDISELEDNALNLLEEKEGLETEIQDLEEFLVGSEKTLQKIEEEASIDQKKEEAEIHHYQVRIDEILGHLPDNFKREFIPVFEQFKDKRPLAFLSKGMCRECRYIIPRAVEEALHRSFTIEYCPNCSRVLIPEHIPH